MILCVGALKQEIACVKSLMGGRRDSSHSAQRLFRGRFNGVDVLLVQTGVGKVAAQASMQFALRRYPITAAIAFGFAGALHDEIAAGDLILASSINAEAHPPDGSAPHSPSTFCSDDLLLNRAKRSLDQANLPYRCSSLVSVQKMLSDPGEKHSLARSSNAMIVDMESYWIAEIAAAQALPILFVRAVSDDVGDRLPPFGEFLAPDGRWNIPRALRYFATHPSEVRLLKRLYRNSLKARASLASAFPHLIAAVTQARKAGNS